MIRVLSILCLAAALSCAHAQAPAPVPPARVAELPGRQLGPGERAELRRHVMAEQARKARRGQDEETSTAAAPRQLDPLQRAQLREQLREQAAAQRADGARGGPQGGAQGGSQGGKR